MGNAMAEIPEMESQIRAMAKREAWYHGIDNPTAVGNIVESVRYREFRRAIEPYERFRNRPISDWLSLQVRPDATQPDWLIENTRLWDELIVGIARKYGYSPQSDGCVNIEVDGKPERTVMPATPDDAATGSPK